MRGIGQQVDPAGVLEPDPVGDVVDERVQRGLPLGEGFLDLNMVGDVGVGSHGATIRQGAAADFEGAALARAPNIVVGRRMVSRFVIPRLQDARQESPGVVVAQPAEVFAEIAARLLPKHQLVRRGSALQQVRGQLEQLERTLVVEHAAPFGIEAHDALVDVLQRDGQRVICPQAVGDVLDRAFVEQRLSVRAGDHAGVLPDPDAFTGLVAMDLGDEVVHFAVGLQQRTERLASARLHIPMSADVVHRSQHFGFGREAVEANQRRIGPQLATLKAAAVCAQRQPVEEGGEVVVRHGG